MAWYYWLWIATSIPWFLMTYTALVLLTTEPTHPTNVPSFFYVISPWTLFLIYPLIALPIALTWPLSVVNLLVRRDKKFFEGEETHG